MTFAEFPSERTASVSSRSFTVTSKSNFLTCTVAASVVCTSPLAVTTVVGLGIRKSSSLSWSTRALMLRNLQQILFPQDLLRMVLGDTNRSLVTGLFSDLYDIRGQSPRVSASTSLLSISS